jgi:hypothetical protein
MYSPQPVDASDLPSPRIGARMIYDEVNRRVLLFGGAYYDNGYIFYNDLWSYRYETNSWTEIDTADSPGGRFSTPLVYDPDTHQIIMFSGSVHLDDSHPMDTWAYDVTTNTWERMSPKVAPKRQYGHYFVYDRLHKRPLMLGGHWSEGENHGYTDGLWQYDYGSDTWTLLQSKPALPKRYWHTLTYNTNNGEVTVFSGSRGGANLYNDTWILDTNTMQWKEVDSKVKPKARCCAEGVYDPGNDVTLIFGGTDFSAYFNDLWALDSSGQWKQMPREGTPVQPK